MEPELKFILESIQGQIKDNRESVEKTLRSGLKGVRVYVDANSEIIYAKIDTLIESDKRRNGRIDDNKDDIKTLNNRTGKLEKKTGWIGFVINNKAISVIIILALLFGMSILANKIDFKKTIENKTGIIIEE